MVKPERVRGFLEDLARRVEGELRHDAVSRVLYSTDASIYQVMPHAVLFPRSKGDVEAAVRTAGEYGISILPRTSGSSLAGQAVGESLVLDFTRHLDDLIEVCPEERWVRVQPGIVLDELNRRLAGVGLKFGPDPASSNRAAVGGIVANNSTGSHSIQFGMTADHVLETEVVLHDGSIARFGPLDPAELERVRRGGDLAGRLHDRVAEIAARGRDTILAGTPRHWRRCGGYNLDRFVEGASFRVSPDERFNLARLLCGSEGTLGAMTEIRLGLVPLPVRTALAIVQFDDLHAALAATPEILETSPTAVELLDHLGLSLCRDIPLYARKLGTFLAGDPHCILITEYQESTDAELSARLSDLERHLEHLRIPARVVPILDPAVQADVWLVRKAALGFLMSVRGDRKPIPFIEDAAVPVEDLAEYVTRVESFCADLGTRVALYAHASGGCIHIRPLIDTKIATEIAKLPVIGEFAADLLGGFGGSLSSEHGDGRSRTWLAERFYGPDLYRLYREVKAAFDPEDRFNPGNVVDGPAMVENLRYGEGYRTLAAPERIGFAPEGGFARAIEMCNGAGVCRKRTEGTMCPSFMVTREEEHSTRGRANLLRAALSGLLPPEALLGRRMYAAMDLCVECKACRSECPSSVDMARIKMEFLARYQSRHGVPPRSRLFAGVARAGRLLSGPLAPVVDLALAHPAVRWGLERSLGISRRRVLPGFATRSFLSWFARRRDARRDGNPVCLFHDTFATYQDPAVAIAATELLEAVGSRVVVPGHRCCGRPMLSKGLLSEARQVARHTLGRLALQARRGVPIVFLEPSCLSAVTEDYRYLLPDDSRVDLVAGACRSLEEYLVEADEAGRLDREVFGGSARRLLLHGHCHEKALSGTEATRRALLLPPGHEVEEVDSGCCGMAGSFGMEAEHYDLSMAMAERRLLPAVRATDPDTAIVATGSSCRLQIEHGADRHAVHPVRILREALAIRE